MKGRIRPLLRHIMTETGRLQARQSMNFTAKPPIQVLAVINEALPESVGVHDSACKYSYCLLPCRKVCMHEIWR